MGYMHIENLYKNQNILMFKECYALEKINGTSAHISYSITTKRISFFSGCANNDMFVALFDMDALRESFSHFDCDVTIYGEAYGGKIQGKSALYGKNMKFIVFEVQVGSVFLTVPDAEKVALSFGLEFVSYNRIPATLEAIEEQKLLDSVQAVRNGMGSGLKREGVVLHPLVEVRLNNGARIICKHKNEEERETKTKRDLDPEKLKVLQEGAAIAEEWVTPIRLNHVLDKLPSDLSFENIPDVIKAMMEDVYREGAGEFVDSKEARSAISRKTVALFKDFLKQKLM